MKIKIKYVSKDILGIESFENGDWIDLRSAKRVDLKKGEYALIPLGVCMKLPKGYEANVVPRSSTFKMWGILQTNGYAVIDASYCGENDQWMMPVYATRDTTIDINDRICQFRINKKMKKPKLITVSKMSDNSRGGFGSTGKK